MPWALAAGRSTSPTASSCSVAPEAYRVQERQGGRAGEGRDADRRRGNGAAADPGDRAMTWRWIPEWETVGRTGNGVPVGVGQPTLLIGGG